MPSLGLLLCCSLPALGQEHVFTPHNVAKLRMVTSAVVSPDGTQVAYVLSVPRNLPKEKDGPAWAELHVVDTKGNSTPYITGQVTIEAIAWAPDGKSISFLTKREQDLFKALYVIPIKGGEARRLVTQSSDIISYSWAPGGRQVALLMAEPLSKGQKAQQDLGFTQEIYEEAVPPVRVWIATLPVGDKPAEPVRMLKLEGSASELHWSPVGDRLAVALAPTPLIDDHLMFRKVHIVDVKTGKATNLNNPGKMGQLAWAPDGKQLALISGADKHDPKEGRLWIYEDGWVDTGAEAPWHVESIAWPNTKTRVSSTLISQVADGVQTAVHYKERNDRGKYTGGSLLGYPPSGPILGNVTTAQDGVSLAFVGHTPQHPPEVYYLRMPADKKLGSQTLEPVRLTNSNPWLRTMQFAAQETVKYKARDGLELEGVLVRPLDEKTGQRYPLVMIVHGGPEAHISNGWTTLYHSLGQVGAARGMAVFYPNYRGSTGRGVAFSMLGQKEAAGKEFDDLIDAVDHLVGTGLVDPKKVGITGGSYGGYATAWGSTYYSDRFAAGVMFVGISNSVSKVGTTDIPHEMHLVHHRKWLWEDWDYFLKSSPIYHVEKAKTPLLILHGKADPRVHPSQSLELYRHLKVRGKAPVRLVFYPGEGHGNRRAASRYDYNLRLLQWMDHYLKGPGGAPPPYELDYGTSSNSASAGKGWRDLPLREQDRRPAVEASLTSPYWLGYGCPCCIGP